MRWFLKRISEPSSFAGIGLIIAGVAQISHNPEAGLGMVTAGVAAIFKAEQPSPK